MNAAPTMTTSTSTGVDDPDPAPSPRPHHRLARAYLVWIGALVAYVIAVMNRTSFGVLEVKAAQHFGVGASMLSMFVVVQVAVYAVMQIPAGILLDRFGSRRLLTIGAILMALGQLSLAFVPSVGLALFARILVGAGDALTFIAVLRVVALWFPPRLAPVLTQVSGLVGQLGQILSVVPFLAFASTHSWASAFTGIAAVGLFAAAVAWMLVRDRPQQYRSTSPRRTFPVRVLIVDAVKEPGTQLGFWTHMISQFSMNVFLLMWGHSFLHIGHGLSAATVSWLLVVNVVASAIFGPLIGELVARHPLRRSWLVLFISGTMVAGWCLVLIPSGPLPLWAIVIFMIILALGGPGSMIGFDFARTSNPPDRLGTATGVVNTGGFVSALVGIFLVGLILDGFGAVAPGEYSLDAYRWAFAALAGIWIVALIGVVISRNALRRKMAARGVVIPPLRQALKAWRLASRASRSSS